MYATGDGGPENDAEAVNWYRKAANQSDPSAQLNLGNMYANGEGVPENNIKAFSRWEMANTQGISEAGRNLNSLKKEITHKKIAQAQALAARCWAAKLQDRD